MRKKPRNALGCDGVSLSLPSGCKAKPRGGDGEARGERVNASMRLAD